jgi:hypothetical protein
MRRSFAVLAPALLLAACGPKPEEVAAKFEATFNTNDAQAILAAFGDEPFVKIDGESMLNNDEIVSWLDRVMPKKPQMKATSAKTGSHGKLDWDLTIERADWKALGLDPLPYKAEAVFDRDKLKLLTLTMDEEAHTKLVTTIANRNDRWLAALQDAIKTRNAPAVTQLLTEDGKVEIPDVKTPFKKATMAGLPKELEKGNIEITCCAKKNGDGTWSGTYVSDHYKNDLRFDTLAVTSTPAFADDGHIRSLVIAWTPESKSKIETALANPEANATPPKKHK